MKLFTVGPVQASTDTLALGSRQLPYFRTDEFSAKMLAMSRKLISLAGAGEDAKTFFLTASGTGAMEAAVINVFHKGDRLLVISGGSFGRRFEEICTLHGIGFDAVRLKFGEKLTAAHLSAFSDIPYTGMLVNIHETSTGQLYDIGLLSEFCRARRMYLVVDAISSFLADAYNMRDSSIDLTILSSQKGLALPPGVSVIIANSRIVNERIAQSEPQSMYFNLKEYMKNFERGQTPFTPAVGILLQMEQRVDEIYQAGVDASVNRCGMLARDFRARLKGNTLGLKVPDYPLSNALTPVICTRHNARHIFRELKDKYGIFVTPNGGELGDEVLRVGHLGDLHTSDYDFLLEKLKKVVD